MVIIANDPPGTGGLNKQIKRREGEEEKGVEWKETEKGVARVCLREQEGTRGVVVVLVVVVVGQRYVEGWIEEEEEEKGDRARIIRLDISGIFTKGTRRNACSIS